MGDNLASVTRLITILGWLQVVVFLELASPCGAQGIKPIQVPLTAEHWTVVDDGESTAKPDVQFIGHEGFPQGALVIKSGSAVLNGFSFRDGTIEFDMKSMAQDIPGIQLRQQGPRGRQDAEEFYVRTFPECRASDDCIQYAPVIHGFMLWNAYPQYQRRAFILDGWNHIKLVVSGRRMNVYVNRQPEPALVVGSLESGSSQGGIQLRGPAVFANLEVTPRAVEGLPGQPAPDPTAGDHGIVRQWQLGGLTPGHYGIAPRYAEQPGAASEWQHVTAGRFGTVNLNRNFILTQAPPSLTWLRYRVQSDRDQQKHVSLGWLGQVWVFVNGKLVAQGKNFYDPEWERRNPDGRLSLENGSFNIPLKRGSNEVMIALYECVHDGSHKANRYGWGVAMRYDNPSGTHWIE